MNSGPDRIVCPKCRANNMPGQPTCWSCGASLPPPEALSALQAAAPVGMPAAWSGPSGARRPRPAVWIMVAVCAVLAAVVVLGVLRARRPGPDSAVSARQAELNALAGQMMRERMGRAGGSASGPPDELTAEARRKVQQLEEQLGQSAPPADSSGRVHLQSGGSVSREEWERAARSLRN